MYVFFFISWRLITLQYCSGFCHTLTWISYGFTCIPHPDPPSHLPLHPIPLGLPSAPGPSTCLMHPTWAGDLFNVCTFKASRFLSEELRLWLLFEDTHWSKVHIVKAMGRRKWQFMTVFLPREACGQRSLLGCCPLVAQGWTRLKWLSIHACMVFPVVMYRYESLTVKKAEHWRIDVFELWCWKRLLRVPWTARRANYSILKEISPKYSLEGLMLKLKLQYFGHLMQRANSLEKTLLLGKIEGGRRRGKQWWRWLDSITDATDMNLSQFRR